MTEQRIQHEVEIDTYKYEIRQLNIKLRNAYESVGLGELAHSLDADFQRLIQENAYLREENLRLENQLLDITVNKMGAESGKNASQSSEHNISNNNDADNISPKKKYEEEALQYHHNYQRLLSKLKRSGLERKHLSLAYEDLKSKERQYLLQKRMHDDMSRRLKYTYADLTKYKKENEELVKKDMELDRAYQALQVYCKELQESNQSLLNENTDVMKECQLLKTRLNDLELEHSRIVKVKKFADKHSAHRQPSLGHILERDGMRNVRNGYKSPSKVKFENEENVINSNYKGAATSTRGGMIDNQLVRGYEAQRYPPASLPTHPISSPYPLLQPPGAGYGLEKLMSAPNTPPSEIEQILLTLQSSMVHTNPTLLPLVRKLEQEIHTERLRALDHKSKLLNQIEVVNRGKNGKKT
jgi:regulator of replication initiation timing